MATKDEVIAAIAAEAKQVADGIAALEAKVVELTNAKIGATPEELDGILQSIKDIYTPKAPVETVPGGEPETLPA